MGCPALDAMRARDGGGRSAELGAEPDVEVVLDDSWSTDRITGRGPGEAPGRPARAAGAARARSRPTLPAARARPLPLSMVRLDLDAAGEPLSARLRAARCATATTAGSRSSSSRRSQRRRKPSPSGSSGSSSKDARPVRKADPSTSVTTADRPATPTLPRSNVPLPEVPERRTVSSLPLPSRLPVMTAPGLRSTVLLDDALPN